MYKDNKHCACCGCDLNYEEQIDYIKAIFATYIENPDNLENLMATCRKCSILEKLVM
jgi:5-methylcytosine-specific restriction endonuclease McrA